MAATVRSLSPEQMQSIITRYLNGEGITDLAAEAGVHPSSLYRWMLTDLGDETYYEVQTQALLQKVITADELLRDCQAMLLQPDISVSEIARIRELISIAKERMRYSRWDAERRRPHLLGQKQESLHAVEIRVNRQVPIQIGSSNPSTILLENRSQNAETPHGSSAE